MQENSNKNVVIGVIAVIVLSIVCLCCSAIFLILYNTDPKPTIENVDDNILPTRTTEIEPEVEVTDSPVVPTITEESTANSDYKTLGVSYDDVMFGLGTRFDMQQGDDIDGLPYFTAKNDPDVFLQVLGKKEDLSVVGISVYVTKKDKEISAQDQLILDQVFTNVLGESADEASAWSKNISKYLSENNPKTQIEYGSNTVTMEYESEYSTIYIEIFPTYK